MHRVVQPLRQGFLGGLVCVALCITACTMQNSDAPVIPDPDTSGFDATVTERIAELQGRIRENPDSAKAWGKLGMAFAAHRLIDEALACYAEAERLDPEEFRWPYLAALRMIDATPEALLETFRRAHRLDPDYVPLNVRMGQLLLDNERASEALPFFRHARDLEPENSHALLGLGRISFLEGDYASSLAFLEQAAESRPRHREVQILLARVYKAAGQLESARQAGERARDDSRSMRLRDPLYAKVGSAGVGVEHVLRRARRLIRQRRFDEAVSALEEAREVRDSPDLRRELGHALAGAGRIDEAVAEWEEANRLNPGFVEIEDELRELGVGR